MMNYDPNAGLDMIKDIPPPAEESKKSSVPTGLLRNDQENKIDTSQMADFSSPIEEVMAGPGQMMQDEIMGSARIPSGQKSSYRSEEQGESKKIKSSHPFGLTDDQFHAAIAGIVAVIAFSKPVQQRLISMIPNFLNESSELTTTGMVVTALVAALLFYLVKQYMIK
jgi:hypothetical protein